MGMAGNAASSGESFAQYFYNSSYGPNATTLLNAQGTASGIVVLWSNFYAETAAGQIVTLIHELIHSMTGLVGHDAIVQKFGITVGPRQTASQAIDAWIQNGCHN